jgi:hypothetical protein
VRALLRRPAEHYPATEPASKAGNHLARLHDLSFEAEVRLTCADGGEGSALARPQLLPAQPPGGNVTDCPAGGRRRGGCSMSNQQTADAAELYDLEHHFPVGWALAALGACNIGATVLMLLAQMCASTHPVWFPGATGGRMKVKT